MINPIKAVALGILVCCSPAAVAAQPAPGAFVQAEGGRVYYETCGSGPKAIVLIHDGVADSSVWDDVWPILCKDFRVMRYDRRGYGRTPAASAPYAPVDDLTAVMNAAGLTRASLIASSAGGGLAVDFTLAHPGAVERLVLVGPAISGLKNSDHFQARLRELGELLPRDPMAAIKASWLLAPGHENAARRVLVLLAARKDAAPGAAPKPAPLAAPRLSQIKAPTLILVGEADVADNQAQAGVAEYAIPGSRRVVVRDAGHMMYLEHPQAFAEQVAGFIR